MYCCQLCRFFLCKQKTAYEMRISDWSSDVCSSDLPRGDHLPVAKFFNPMGAGVWLATMLEPDGDTLHGIADLDMDYVDYGLFSLAELQGLDVGLQLGVERDILFETTAPISVWIDIADIAGGIRAEIGRAHV